MLDELSAALEKLRQAENRIRADGPPAPPNIWIDPQQVGDRKYARLRSDRPQLAWKGKKLRSLSRWGSEEHRDWERRIQRREALAEIELRRTAIQGVLERELSPKTKLWLPEDLNRIEH